MSEQIFTIGYSFQLEKEGLDQSWGSYRKKTLTKAKRITGPFTVETREGMLVCKDGWLVIDSEGFLYPIAASEFERIYVEDSGNELDSISFLNDKDFNNYINNSSMGLFEATDKSFKEDDSIEL